MKNKISGLFDDIAESYDRLNRTLSFNTDIGWRKKLVKLSGASRGEKILDVCTGTGDIEIEFAERTKVEKIFGVDFSRAMLEGGAKKIAESGHEERINNLMADALRLPFGDGTFNVVTMGFGLRNLTDYRGGISEMARVIKRDGRLLLLEFTMPERKLFTGLYGFYLRRILPVIGGTLTGNKSAYEYLSDSIAGFLKPVEVLEIMEEVGLKNLEAFSLMWGTVYIYQGVK